MQSPRGAGAFCAVSPSSFASVTDPTLHRHGWRSPRATSDEQQQQQQQRHMVSRQIPSRFRSLLRYDALSSPPLLSSEAAATGPRSPRATTAPCSPSRPRAGEGEGDATDPQVGVSSGKKTNLDELKWFQHRWLDKHGKNSHLKEYREKLALLRRWFESLDADGSGEVGLDELEDPLVSVGLARSREEVQKLIDQVDKDGSGEVTFAEFLSMMTPEKPKRDRHRQPLHKAKLRVQGELSSQAMDTNTSTSGDRGTGSGVVVSVRRPGGVGAIQRGQPATLRRTSTSVGRPPPSQPPGTGGTGSSNPVVKLFDDLQSGKLGDLAIPFPVLITAYRRRMLLNAHMADDPTARRLGTSVLQALESTRRDVSGHSGSLAREGSVVTNSHRRGSATALSSPSSYLKSYISNAEAAAETSRSVGTSTSTSTQLPSLRADTPSNK